MLRNAFILLLGLTIPSTSFAQDAVYEGKWVTTNRKLEGIMTCVAKETAPEQWQGRFYGVWSGVPFDYTVKFSGPPSELKGRANIDGADYTWTGVMTADKTSAFQVKFTGNRYTGYFDLKERVSLTQATKSAVR